MEEALLLVERLIATVARAFYNDTTVVVLDILSREAYLRHEEIAPRLRLAPKDVQKVLNQLEAEWLIRAEDNLMEDQRNSKCYYIDYQLFVNVVRFRIHCMQQELKVKQTSASQRLQFQCPTCESICSELDAQRSVSADHKFVCSNCCPSENIRGVKAEKPFTLVQIDTEGKLKEMMSLEKKLNEQMKESELHDGIYFILDRLKNISLPQNRPSSNMKCGYLSSTVSNAETLKIIEENSKMRGNIVQLKKGEQPVAALSTNRDALGRKFDIEFDMDSEKTTPAINKTGTGAVKRVKIEGSSEATAVKTGLPPLAADIRPKGEISFLTKSGVKGTDELIKAVAQRQLERNGEDGETVATISSQSGVAPSQDAAVVGSVTAIAEADEDDEDDDNQQWED